MSIIKLTLDHVRNIEHASLTPDPKLNIIYGANASGKTSLLEAIHLLGSARSFRTARVNQIISRDQACLTVFAHVAGIQQAADMHHLENIGLERCKDKTRIRINQENVQQSSILATKLPLQVITPESHDILEQGPKFRRQLLDWGLFHVKQGYLDTVKAYLRVLRQRNAALRKTSAVANTESDSAQQEHARVLVKSFNKPLVDGAEQVNHYRQDYVASIQDKIIDMTQQLCGETITVHYQSGWKAGEDYADALAKQFDSDCNRHHTQSGPHRADLVFKVAGVPIQQAFSRGQQKMLVCALRLAQLQYYFEQTGHAAVVLVDDLAAELDKTHRQRLLALLMASEAQVFITLTDKDLLDSSNISSKKMFHVEHGKITDVAASVV